MCIYVALNFFFT